MGERPVTTARLIEALQGFPVEAERQRAETLAQADEAADAAVLARSLVEAGCLTQYQADMLLAGRRDDLVFGHYVLLEPVGAGGMGQVFKAWHGLLHRPVAVKVIRNPDPKALDRFRREIRLLAQLTHPNIVAAHDAISAGDRLVLVMEYCDGVTLGRLLRDGGPLAIGTACHCAVQAADGLQHAFERGLVHRDIKPDNLILQGSTVKVLDFGLARLRPADGAESTGLTSEHTVLGTPDFIAPEQALDVRRADVRSDIYSLGATLYCLLTGQVPFPGGTVQEKLLRHQVESPLPIRQVRPEVPAEVGAIVDRMLRKSPDERYQTPAEVATALGPFAAYEPLVLPAKPAEDEDELPSTGVPTFPAPLPEPAEDWRTWSPTSAVRTRVAGGRKRLWGVIAGAAVGCILLAGGALYLFGAFDGQKPADSGTPAGPVAETSAPRLAAAEAFIELVYELKENPNRINSLAFSHDSTLLAVACGRLPPMDAEANGGVVVWDVTGRKVLNLIGPQDFPGYLSVAFSPKERLLAATTGYWNWKSDSFQSEVQLWDPVENRRLATLTSHARGVGHVTFSPDGRVLCTIGRWEDRTIRFWDVADLLRHGKRVDESNPAHLGHIDWAKGADQDPGMVFAAAFSPDGNRLAACNHAGVVNLYQKSRVGVWKLTRSETCPDCNILYQVGFSPDGERIAVAGGKHNLPYDQTPQVSWWHAGLLTGRRKMLNRSDVWSMSFAPGSRHVLTGDADGDVALWDLDREKVVGRLKAHDGWASVALAPDGSTLASGGGLDRVVKVWRLHVPK
jgi:serine/threonine-protein kinase